MTSTAPTRGWPPRCFSISICAMAALEERGLVQVSLNVVDHEKNPLYRVLELIRTEAKRWGVEVVESEVCGMVPAAALLDSVAYYMHIAAFDPKQVIELQLLEMLGDNEA